MINEDVLLHIIKEINYQLTGIANEIDPQKFPMDLIGIGDGYISLKYLREKTMRLKLHLEWLDAEMDDNWE